MKRETKFSFESLIKFISILNSVSGSDEIKKGFDNGKFSTWDQDSQDHIRKFLLSDEDRNSYINIAKDMLLKNNITYLNLDDAWSVVHRVRSLKLLNEILADNVEVTSLGVYSWYKQVNKELFELTSTCSSIKLIKLFVSNNAMLEDENLMTIADGIRTSNSNTSLKLYLRNSKISLDGKENIIRALNKSDIKSFDLITCEDNEPGIANKLEKDLSYHWFRQSEVILQTASYESHSNYDYHVEQLGETEINEV